MTRSPGPRRPVPLLSTAVRRTAYGVLVVSWPCMTAVASRLLARSADRWREEFEQTPESTADELTAEPTPEEQPLCVS